MSNVDPNTGKAIKKAVKKAVEKPVKKVVFPKAVFLKAVKKSCIFKKKL